MTRGDFIKLLEAEIDKLHGSEQPFFNSNPAIAVYDGTSELILLAMTKAYDLGRSAGKCPCCNCPDCSGASIIG